MVLETETSNLILSLILTLKLLEAEVCIDKIWEKFGKNAIITEDVGEPSE